MHRFPRLFAIKKEHKNMDDALSHKPKSKSMDLAHSPRKLIRTNAAKNFKFTPSESSSTSSSVHGSSARTRSLDLPQDMEMPSYRIEGNTDGELDLIYQSLGLSGPEDFEIPKDAYDLMKNRASSDVIQRPKIDHFGLNEPVFPKQKANKFVEPAPHRCGNTIRTIVALDPDSGGRDWKQPVVLQTLTPPPGRVGGGIKGDRPPILTAPPPMTLPPLDDGYCSSWDLLHRLAPDGDIRSTFRRDDSSDDDVETDGENNVKEGTNDVRLGETIILSGSCSFTTSNDDDSSSTTTEPVSIISPNGGGRMNISQWSQGRLLGRGSFGTVYEGYSRYVHFSVF